MDDIKLMDNLQKHTHANYCHRNKSCCFGFPKPPTTQNLISQPSIDDHDEMMENAKSLLQTVQNTLTTADVHCYVRQCTLMCIFALDSFMCKWSRVF